MNKYKNVTRLAHRGHSGAIMNAGTPNVTLGGQKEGRK